DIARAARVNKATIYYHFKNKMAVFFEITVSAIYEIMAQARPIVDSEMTPEKKLEALIDNHIRWLISHPGRVGFYPLLKLNLTPKLFSDYLKARDEYLALFQKVIDEGVLKGYYHHLNRRYDALFIVTFLNNIVQRTESCQGLSNEEIVRSAFNLISQALKNP
ncbi:MAG: TetR/AcrR family transcriptional regulator, partial [Deltaproteobacteria bacterium]|nr:TetR/AcrR family transcriptional regulator [Deltaproteobacteria bacterium]